MIQRSIQLLDLIEKEVLENIVRDFTRATRVASVLVDTDGQPITREHNFCRLCKDFCRSTPAGRARCYASDRFGGEEGNKSGKPFFIYKCLNAGLMDSATPIIVEGYHVATLVMGQVLTKPLPLEVAIENARTIGIEDIAGYLSALREVPVMSYQRLQAVVRLMNTIAKTISSLAIQKYLAQKASQKNLHNIINSVSDAIISTDTEGVITLVNKAAAGMFGRDTPSLVGLPIFSLFRDPDAFRGFLFDKKNRAPRDASQTFEGLGKDGQYFYVQASFQKRFRFRREAAGYVAVLRDVTQEKRVEKMKEDLIGMLTHDMGNPILSIQRVLELMLDGHIGSLSARGSDLVALALDSTHKLSGMVANFLDIFLDENNALTLNLTLGDMDTVLTESIRQVGFPSGDKNVAIIFQPGNAALPIPADWSRIQRTCVNLLENAIRYSPEGGIISIRARLKKGHDQSEYLMVTIEDQGSGIGVEKQTLVFEKFYTVDNHDRGKRRGVGLGLTFSKMVVEAHGGSICVESPYADHCGHEINGCRFRFRIPVPHARDITGSEEAYDA